MKLQYELKEEDFLEFQLFTASQSPTVYRKKIRGWMFLSLLGLICTIAFAVQQNIPMIIYFGSITVLIALLFPTYFKWRYKRHYTKFIQENYQQRFGLEFTLEFNGKTIYAADKTGNATLKLSEMDGLDETENYFYLKQSTGASLIIPKRGIADITAFENLMGKLKLVIQNKSNWKL